jgi:hypothetical protein
VASGNDQNPLAIMTTQTTAHSVINVSRMAEYGSTWRSGSGLAGRRLPQLTMARVVQNTITTSVSVCVSYHRRLLTTAPRSEHSARLHFKDSQCRLQFMYSLSDFGVFANLVLAEPSANHELHPPNLTGDCASAK